MLARFNIYPCQDVKHNSKSYIYLGPDLECSLILSLNISGQLCDDNFSPIYSKIDQRAAIYKHMHNYAKANIAKVNIFIRDSYYAKMKTDEQMTFVSFIGNAGGLMGLCLGLSAISLFEIVYFTCILICKCLGKRFSNQTNTFGVDE